MKKGKILQIRLSEEDMVLVDWKAKAEGKTVSAWARAKILNGGNDGNGSKQVGSAVPGLPNGVLDQGMAGTLPVVPHVKSSGTKPTTSRYDDWNASRGQVKRECGYCNGRRWIFDKGQKVDCPRCV